MTLLLSGQENATTHSFFAAIQTLKMGFYSINITGLYIVLMFVNAYQRQQPLSRRHLSKILHFQFKIKFSFL